MSEIVARLSHKIDENESKIRAWEMRYNGEAPLTFLSPESRAALNNRLSALNINFCKLAVDALAERIRIIGFQVGNSSDALLWRAWRACGMQDGAAQVVTDALMSGQGFLSIWADSSGQPVARAEDPSQCVLLRDPVSGEATHGMKRWLDSGDAYATHYEPDRITMLKSASHVVEGGTVPADGWTTLKALPNPLGTIPLLAVVNRGRVREVNGISEMAAIADLNDALIKVSVDALVTSEHYAKPRRWASGLEIKEDDDGNPIDPFPNPSTKLWQSEDPETKFGQFQQSDMSSYSSLTDSLLSQISALSGLPAHYVFAMLQPSTGEDARAKEVTLVSRAEKKIDSFDLTFARAAALMVAVRDGVDYRKVEAEPVWADAASRTTAQEADAAIKLGSGDRPILPLRTVRARLGYTPTQIDGMERQEAADMAMRTAVGQ